MQHRRRARTENPNGLPNASKLGVLARTQNNVHIAMVSTPSTTNNRRSSPSLFRQRSAVRKEAYKKANQDS